MKNDVKLPSGTILHHNDELTSQTAKELGANFLEGNNLPDNEPGKPYTFVCENEGFKGLMETTKGAKFPYLRGTVLNHEGKEVARFNENRVMLCGITSVFDAAKSGASLTFNSVGKQTRWIKPVSEVVTEAAKEEVAA